MTAAARAAPVPVSTYLATAFGLGRIPVMPGTIASMVAFPLGWWIGLLLGWMGLTIAALFVFLIGWGACGAHARRVGIKDPKECVLDEVAGMWLAMTALPLVDGFFHWLPCVLAFAAFRFFDIVKPWPISRAQQLEGGIGIMLDDLAAGAAAGVLVLIGGFANLY